MLVLSRKKNQEVCLPDMGVNIRILEIKGNSVRLGIDAPEEVHILRGELNDIRSEFESDYVGPLSDRAGCIEAVA